MRYGIAVATRPRQLPLPWKEDQVWTRLPTPCGQQCQQELARLLAQVAQTDPHQPATGNADHERQGAAGTL